MKVTLINAQIREANNLVPPLSILSLGSFLKSRGIDLQLIDEDIFLTDFIPEICSFSPSLVGISFLTPAYSRVRTLIRLLREKLPGIPICVGGFHPSVLPEQTLRDLQPDFCVIGEGEQTLFEAANAIAHGAAISNIPGLAFLDREGKICTTPSRPLIHDLDTLPLPATDLLDFDRYLRPPGLFRGMAMDRVTTIWTSRGCPFPCSYCGGRSLYDGRVRFRSPDSVKRELKLLTDRHRVRGVWIIDECFTIDRDRSLEIARILKEFNLAWGMQTRVDLLDRELISSFRQSGCTEINFGIESGSERILRLLRKGTTREQAERVFQWCRAERIRTTANFMIGSPGESESEMNESFEFAKKLKASFTVFHITTPLPGTELYEHALATGLIEDDSEFDEKWVHRASPRPLMKTDIDPHRLMRLRASYQNHFFIRNYLTLNNIRYGLSLIPKLIDHPEIVSTAFRAYRQFGRIDSFIETMVAMLNGSVQNDT